MKTFMFKNFPEQWQTSHLKEKGIPTETAIQKNSLPITEGDNILGISPTGTGKTLATFYI